MHFSNCQALLRAVLCTCLLSAGWLSSAQAVLRDTVTAGDWNTAGNWSGAAVPTPGVDAVNVDLTMSVGAITSYGSTVPAEVSTFTNGIVNITGAPITLTQVAGSTTRQVAGNYAFVTGTGSFVNNGLFELQAPGAYGLLIYNGSPTFVNNGTGANGFVMTQNNSWLQLGYNAGDTPVFQNNGRFEIALPNTSSAAFISSQSATSNLGQYQATQPITFTQGALVFAAPNVTSYTNASFNNLFGALNATSELRLAGEIQTINLTAAGIGAANLARVSIGHDSSFGRQLVAHPLGTTINVPEADGGIFFNNVMGPALSPTINMPTGRTVTNQAGSLIKGGNTTFITGAGEFINNGKFTLSTAGTYGLLLYNNAPKFTNNGTVLMNQNNSRLELGFSVGDAPIFQNNGTLEVALPATTSTAYIGAQNANSTLGQYLATSPITFTQGALIFSPPNITSYTNTSFNNLFGTFTANSELRLAGVIKEINLTAAGIGASKLARVSIASDANFGGKMVAHPTGTTIYVPEADGGISFNNLLAVLNPEINIPTGRTVTNQAGSLIKAGASTFITGSGTFINDGKVTLSAKSTYGLLIYNGTQSFTNNGVLEFTQNTADLILGFSGADSSTFNNQAGGIVRSNLPSGANLATISETGGTGTFNNFGTVEALSGTLRINSQVSTPQVTATSLTGGTWKVLAGANTATLDLQGNAAGSITTIGSGAGVVLSKAGAGSALFPQLGAIQNLDGSFYVHGMSHTVSSAMAVTGTLGGSGTIATPGTITFNGGTLNPAALNGGAGTLNVVGNLVLSNTTQLNFSLATGGIVGGVNDLVTITGNLTLDGVLNVTELPGFGAGGAYRLFNYTGSLTNLGLIVSNPIFVIDTTVAGQVNLLLVPEPATGLLLLAGICLFRRRKAAGKQANSAATKV